MENIQEAGKERIVIGMGRLDEFRENGIQRERAGGSEYDTKMGMRSESAGQEKNVSVSRNGQKAKAVSRGGRKLLKMVLREEFGIDISMENEPIGKEAGGKPFLKNHEDVFFNISHSGEYVVCAVGKVQMGIDIQYHKAVNIEKMAKKILSEEERGAFEKAGCSVEAFYSFWTKKESFLKYTGEGIRRDMKAIDYCGCKFLTLDFQEGYSGGICLPETWDGEILLKEWKE